MSAYLLDWLSLLLRWFHVIAGIAWIGASFYFVWLDNNLRTPPDWKKQKGIKGDLWSIHGGGIYEIAKYELAPETMPATLHWFKWEAYSTWLSGVSLLTVIYYAQASSYLLGGSWGITSPLLAVACGVGLLLATMVFYEALMRSPLRHHTRLFALVLILWLIVLSYVAMHLLSPRAGMIHLGAAIGTIMVANVLLGIMPAQRELVAAIDAGREPDPAPAALAKVRSLHNNYLTLPVIFCMIGSHSAFVYASDWGWLILVVLGLIGAYIRHFFNLRHRDIHRPGILWRGALAILALIAVLAYANRPAAISGAADSEASVPGQTPAVSTAAVMAIVSARCGSCHAANPTQAGFTAPPAGIVLASPLQLQQFRERILQAAVTTHYMPLGNMTGMTESERQQLGAWLNTENQP